MIKVCPNICLQVYLCAVCLIKELFSFFIFFSSHIYIIKDFKKGNQNKLCHKTQAQFLAVFYDKLQHKVQNIKINKMRYKINERV